MLSQPTVIAWQVLVKAAHMLPLFFVLFEAGGKRCDTLTVTQKRAYWVLTSAVKEVPYAPVRDIAFFKTTTTSSQPTIAAISSV